MAIRSCLVLVLLGIAVGRGAAQPESDERVLRLLPSQQLEEILAELKLDFKKSDNANFPGIHYYDFKRGKFNVRLTNYNGKDLMLDCQFQRSVSLERVNDWNKKAKFSRASLHQDKKGAFITLEYNLDVLGGITRGTIRQLLTQFDTEASGFDRFLASTPAAAAVAPAADDKLHVPVTDAAIERVLRDLKVEFKKQSLPTGETIYDFAIDNTSLRLFNYGGKDLMISAVFRKAPLEVINKYNEQRKFVRAVLYTGNNERTALESNLDCLAGASDGMIRYFITIFAPEARHFAGYLAEPK